MHLRKEKRDFLVAADSAAGREAVISEDKKTFEKEGEIKGVLVIGI